MMRTDNDGKVKCFPSRNKITLTRVLSINTFKRFIFCFLFLLINIIINSRTRSYGDIQIAARFEREYHKLILFRKSTPFNSNLIIQNEMPKSENLQKFCKCNFCEFILIM